MDFEKQHIANLQGVDKSILNEYFKIVDEIAAKLPGAGTASMIIEDARLNKQINVAVSSLSDKVFEITESNIINEWGLSGSKFEDEILKYSASKKVLEAITGQQTVFNEKALESFLARKTNGINLSEQIWKYTSTFKDDLTTHIGLGIANGDSHQTIAKRLKNYLKTSEYFFTPAQQSAIQLKVPELWQKMQASKPGTGVYKNGYKNAARLARNEINIAYRTADHKRWKNSGFVTGVEVKLSGSHPATDICDSAQGKYPKTFKFTGWHTNCICYAVPVKLNEKDFDSRIDDILAGKETVPTNKLVKTVPPKFSKWLADNEGRVKGMKNKPYFIRDNFKNNNIKKPAF